MRTELATVQNVGLHVRLVEYNRADERCHHDGKLQNPEEWFHEQNQTASESRKKPRKKIAKKNPSSPPSSIRGDKPVKSPKKPVQIPIEIVNVAKNQTEQKQAEKIGDRKILTEMENLILEELTTPIEIKEDPFHADEEIVIPPQK